MKSFDRTELLLFGAVLIFGLNYPVLKYAVEGVHPFEVNGVRFLLAGLFLALLHRFTTGRGLRDLVASFRSRPLNIMGLGLLGYTLSPTLLVFGLQYTSAGSAALILASSPVWTAMTTRVCSQERIRLSNWFWLLVTVAGAALVSLEQFLIGPTGPHMWFGNLLTLLDAMCWGAFVGLQKQVTDHITPLELTFWGLTVSVPVLLVLNGFFGSAPGAALTSWTILGALVFAGVFSMGIGMVWWNNAVKDLGANSVAVYGNLIPLVALLFGFLLLGEALTTPKLAGAVLVLVGIYFLRRSRIRRTPGRPGPPSG